MLPTDNPSIKPLTPRCHQSHICSFLFIMRKTRNEKSGSESYFLWVHHSLAYNTCEFYPIHLKWFLTCSQKVKGSKEFKMISRHPRFLRRQIWSGNAGMFSSRNWTFKKITSNEPEFFLINSAHLCFEIGRLKWPSEDKVFCPPLP